MSKEQLTLSGLSESASWYQHGEQGGYILSDPLTATQLNPREVPTWLRNEPHLWAGVQYLQQCRDGIRLTIAYGRHETAEDLGDLQRGWYEAQMAAADYCGFECYADTYATRTALMRTAATILLLAGSDGGFNAYVQTARQGDATANGFLLREMRSLALTRTDAFVYDVADDGTASEQYIIRRTNAIIDETGLESALTVPGLVNAREWCMVANTGLNLLKNELDKPLRPLNVLMTIGGAHRDVSRKFGMLGTLVQPKLIRPDRWKNRMAEILPNILQSGTIGRTDIPYLHVLRQGLQKAIRQ